MQRIFLLLLILTFALWYWGLRRAGILFSLTIVGGKIKRQRGTIPARLKADIEDIVLRAHVTDAKIVGVVRDGRPVLRFEGEMTPGVEQQMRNVMGQFSAAEIRNGQKH